MKHFSINFVLVVLFALASTSTAQVHWTKDTLNNPILVPGDPGTWNDYSLGPASILFDGTTYHFWYGGSDGITSRIGYATSSNGITWTPSGGSPVLDVGTPGRWDDTSIESHDVLSIGGTYHMWYAGNDGTYTRVGHATSSDGFTWTKDTLNNPVMDKGPAGDWDDLGVWPDCVYFDGSTYHMWFGGYDGTYSRIGYATSPDRITWTKYDDPSTTNPPFTQSDPVLIPDAGEWDQHSVGAPCVFFDGTKYHMWYTGSSSGWSWQWDGIGYATSSNGITWTKDTLNNPVLTPTAGSWDSQNVGFSRVIWDSTTSQFKMWYGGSSGIGNAKYGYAIAPLVINVPRDVATIQEAINIANDGNIILVEDSTYYENINFRGKAITVASRFLMDGDTSHISNTIIDGSQPSHPDTGSVVRFISGEDTTSVLMGFTITNGTGTKLISTGSGNNFPVIAGGGILCWNSGGRFIQNKIINNTLNDETVALGGGFSAGDIGSNEWVILEKNQIINNMINGGADVGGGGVGLTCNAKIINNMISNDSCISTANIAVGGGIRGINNVNEQRTLFIEDNTITSNFTKGTGVAAQNNFAALGSGINLYGRFKASILRNKISNNQLQSFNTAKGSGGGIYMYLSESGSVISGNIISDNKNEVTGTKYGGGIGLGQFNGLSITNNIIIRNSGSHGAGISLTYNNAEIINNTIINNTASTNGGGLYAENSQPVVINSILWNNQAINGAGIYPPSLTNVRHSDVQGGYAGTGNINVDPLFADTLKYELSDSSLCIGAGIDSIQINMVWYYAPDHDFDGDPRPNPAGCSPDIGAQESPLCEPPNAIEPIPGILPFTYSLRQNYPNPFNPTTNIEFSIPKSEFVTLKVYNILGEEVATLVSEKLAVGKYKYEWDAGSLASGVYLYRIQAGDYAHSKKMVLMK